MSLVGERARRVSQGGRRVTSFRDAGGVRDRPCRSTGSPGGPFTGCLDAEGVTCWRTMVAVSATTAAGSRWGHSIAALPHYSALTLWTVHVVGMFPTPADDETVRPLMNHIDVLPRLSRHRRSLMPSPL
jgi:hypothetical protein